jgi:ketosteroid isomerase-like protein
MMRRVALIALTVTTSCHPASVARSGATAPGSERAVLALVRDYDTAWARRDTAAVGRILAPEYVYFTSTGGVWSRAESLDLLGSPEYALEHATRSELEARRVGSTVIVSSRWQGHGSYRGEAFTDDQRCSLVFALSAEGEWSLAAEHCTQIRAP